MNCATQNSYESLKKCGIINALGGADDDVLLEESGSSDSSNSNDCTISKDDFMGFCNL